MPLVDTPTITDPNEIVDCFANGRIVKFDARKTHKCDEFDREPNFWREKHGDAIVAVQVQSKLVQSMLDEVFNRHKPGEHVDVKEIRDVTRKIGSMKQAVRFGQCKKPLREVLDTIQNEFPNEQIDTSYAYTSLTVEQHRRKQARLRSYAVANSKRFEEFRVETHPVFDRWYFLYNWLWFGWSSGELHLDEFDNNIVQLSGRKLILLYEPGLTAAIDGGHYLTKVASDAPLAPDVLASHRLLKYLPYHLVELGPGDGVVVPAGAYHAVLGLSHDCVTVNTFCVHHYNKKKSPQPTYTFPTGPKGAQLWGLKVARHIYDLTGLVLIKLGPYEFC